MNDHWMNKMEPNENEKWKKKCTMKALMESWNFFPTSPDIEYYIRKAAKTVHE